MNAKIVLGLAGSVMLTACVGLPYEHVDHAPQVVHRAPVIIDSGPAYYVETAPIFVEREYHHPAPHTIVIEPEVYYADEVYLDPHHD